MSGDIVIISTFVAIKIISTLDNNEAEGRHGRNEGYSTNLQFFPIIDSLSRANESPQIARL
jgi:hypothetical protein